MRWRLKYLALFRKQNFTTHTAIVHWNNGKTKVFANLSFSLIEDTHTRQTNLRNDCTKCWQKSSWDE